MQPLWRLRTSSARHQRQDPRWAAATRHLSPWGATTHALPGVAPVVAVQGGRVHLLVIGLTSRLPKALVRALGASPIPLHTETTSALDQLCWHLPRWLPVLATHRPRRAADFALYAVDSWCDTNPDALRVHIPPTRVDGRSLLLSALVAMVSDLVNQPVPGHLALSADIDFAHGRLAPVAHLHRKACGLRVMLPQVRHLLTAPLPEGSTTGILRGVARVEDVLDTLGLSAALVAQLHGSRDARIAHLLSLALGGRAQLHSWNAVAQSAAALLTDATPHQTTLLRFVRAVAQRHDGHTPQRDAMPTVGTICEAVASTSMSLDPDEASAHRLQHHTDLVEQADSEALGSVSERVHAITRALNAGQPVWPAALKLLGAWARYRCALDGPGAWQEAHDLATLACAHWLRARIGHEASYPLSEVWRLTGALPFDPARYHSAAALHARWAAQPGAVTADNYGFVYLSALRACVLLLEAGASPAPELMRCLGLPNTLTASDALGEGLQQIATGQVSPDLPHLRAAAIRWRLRLDRGWTPAALRDLQALSPDQAWLAGADWRCARAASAAEAPEPIDTAPIGPALHRAITRHATLEPGPSLAKALRATAY